MNLYAIEKREPGGEWEIHTYAPSTDLKKIADGLPACAKNTDKEWRVSTFVRIERPQFWIHFQNDSTNDESFQAWRRWEFDGYPTLEAARADLPEARKSYPTARYRVVMTGQAVVETFDALETK